MSPACFVCESLATARFFEAPLDKFTRAMGKTAGVEYWVCDDCGVAFQHPLFSQDEYERFYEIVQRSDAVGYDDASVPARHLKKKARDTAAKWSLFDLIGLQGIVPGRRVFEVGPGEGTLLKSFRDRGYEARGIEPFDRYAEHARTRFGLSVETGYFGPDVIADASADLVVIDNVLEHVMSPFDVLTAIHRALGPQGIVCVLVPNWERVYASNANIAHLTLWSRKALIKLLGRAGFRPIAVVQGRPASAPHEWVAVAQRADAPADVPDLPTPPVAETAASWHRAVDRFHSLERWQQRLGPAFPIAQRAYATLKQARTKLAR